MSWREIWSAVAGGDVRTRVLEAEVVRLRAENRALMNSILGIAGVPPVIVENATEADALRLKVGEAGAAADSGAAGRAVVDAALAKSVEARGRKNVMPMRRRSWHQVNRMLELDAARKLSAKMEE